MIRSSRAVRLGWVGAVLVSTACATAGCAPAEPGVAAYVNDTKITDRQVTDAYEGAGTILNDPDLKSQVLNTLIAGAVADHIAGANGISLDNGQRDTILAGSPLAPLLEIPKAKPVAYDAADQAIVVKQLGAERYVAERAKLTFVLNPRYGVLDPERKVITGGRSGSLAAPPEEQQTPEAVAPQPQPTG